MSENALAASLRHLRSQMAGQRRNEESDEQLLDAFLIRRDEDAFAVLVRRHGPMVLHVCCRVLGQQQDAEDAFQAVFVLLARNAAGLRKKTALAGFLHGAAYRIALTAKRSAARRRKHEGSLRALTQPRSPVDPTDELSWREVRTLLDEEIARLPEKYRSVFVLYHLENLSREETGRRLGLPDATVAKRLAEARKRLGRRLARRGVELTAILAASTLAAQSASALSAGLMTTTIQAALATAAGDSLAGIASASVAELVKDGAAALSSGKFKWAMLLLALCLLGGSGAWVGFRSEAVPSETPPANEKAKLTVPAQPAAKDKGKDAVAYAGCVLGPDGKPIAGARVYFQFATLQEEPIPVRATTDAQGRFAFTLTRKDIPLSADARQADPRKMGHVIVKAEGFTFAWQYVALMQTPQDSKLHVAADDTPLTGRIIDLQGRPLPGLRVSAWSAATPEKGDLTPFIKAIQAREAFLTALVHHAPIRLNNPLNGHLRVSLLPTTTTDADGRFRLHGFAKERLVELRIEGPAIETRNLFVMNRPASSDGGKLLSVPRIKQLPMFGPSEQVGVLANGFDYPAPPGLTVNGTVQDAETKRPIPRAIVEIYMLAGSNLGQDTRYHTVADEQGRYRFTGLRRGPGNRIRIRPPADQPYIPVVKDVPLPIAKGVPGVMSIAEARVDVALDRGVWVDVTATDKHTGRPVLGDVTYFVLPEKVPPKGFFPAPSQFRGAYNGFKPIRNDGTFRFVAAPRRAILAFRTYGDKYPIAREAATIRLPGGDSPANYHAFAEINPKLGDDPVKVKFILSAGRIVKGKLVDPEGRPLTGGALASGLRSDSHLEPEGLEAADFTVLDLHRPRLLCFVNAKKLAGSAVVRGDEKGPITVKMQPWATVSGRLLDADGKPIANADLRFTQIPVREPGQPMSLDTGLHVVQHFAGQPSLDPRTDEQGRFRVERLVPGLKYNLARIELGAQIQWEGLVFANLVLKPGESKDLGDVRLQPFPSRDR